MKKALTFLLVLALIFSMAACGSGFSVGVNMLVQGNIDGLYLGKFDDAYLKLVDSTEAECRQDYLAGLEMEAQYFAYYFDIEILDDDLKAEIVELYKEIYSHSQYTVGEASKLDDSTYAVKVTISPINIVDLVVEDFDSGMEGFFSAYENADPSSMTDEEYAQNMTGIGLKPFSPCSMINCRSWATKKSSPL